METFPRITPFLWFDANAGEAVDFYLSIFKNSRKLDVVRSSAGTPSGPKSMVLTIAFQLDGQKFTALNGGPVFKFNESVSFVVRCDSQDDVDYYWPKLLVGGTESQCGWLKDKFGLSWQVVPARLPDLIKNPKAMRAMMKMKKLDLATLERAAQSQDHLLFWDTEKERALESGSSRRASNLKRLSDDLWLLRCACGQRKLMGK